MGSHSGRDNTKSGTKKTRHDTTAVSVRPVRARRVPPEIRRVRTLIRWVELGE